MDIVITVISLLTLIAAVIIPIWQKRYHRINSRRSFKMYLNKYFADLNFLISEDKLSYNSYGGETEIFECILIDFLKKLEEDFDKHIPINVIEGMVFLQNFQTAMFRIHNIKRTIEEIKIDSLYDKTLEYGYFLNEHDITHNYSILENLSKFVTKIEINDMFTDLKFVEMWEVKDHLVGIKYDSKNLMHWEEDVNLVMRNEQNFKQILFACKQLNSKLNNYKIVQLFYYN